MIRKTIDRSRLAAFFSLTVVFAVACAEETPTSLDPDLLPPEPITVELHFPWEEFASNLAVFGGYGAPAELGTGVLANVFAGTLNARTVVRYGAYPTEVSVRDTLGTTRPDNNLTFIGGRIVAYFDTIASTNDGPVTLALGGLQQEWDVGTVTWESAVDTINDDRVWSEQGAGPVLDWGTAIWDPAEGDSVTFLIDSVIVASMADTSDTGRGVRLEVLSEGVRLQVLRTSLQLNTRPSLNPDSTFYLFTPQKEISFVYDPIPDPPPDGIRIGGAPAWRTILDIAMPKLIHGPPELCASVGCPVSLDAGEVNFGAIVLTSRTTETAFQPTDTIGLDVRPVLLRASLPKAPLGNSLLGTLGKRVSPTAFGDAAGEEVEVPITLYAQDLVRGVDADGDTPPISLALMSVFEPVSISFASFYGPGSGLAPYLKLVITVARPVELP